MKGAISQPREKERRGEMPSKTMGSHSTPAPKKKRAEEKIGSFFPE